MSSPTAQWAVGDRVEVGKLNDPQSRKAGDATSQRLMLGGVLFAANGSLGNTTTTETTVYSRSVAANALSVNGDRLEIALYGAWAANGNVKTVRFKFGAHGTYYTLGAQAVNGGIWNARILLTRLTSTTARAVIQVTTNTAAGVEVTTSVSASLTGLDFTSAQTLSTTLQGTSTSDIVARDYMVWLWPGTAEST